MLAVFDPTSVGDAMRKRLQLNLGLLVELGDEVPSPAGGRAFAALQRGSGGQVIVVVHRAPPDGPSAAEMHQRIAHLRLVGHPLLDLPLDDGELDGHFWSIEPVLQLPDALDRLEDGRLPIPLAVSALRDLSRALAAIHRRGLTHGAINLRTAQIGETGGRLGGFAQTAGGSVRFTSCQAQCSRFRWARSKSFLTSVVAASSVGHGTPC